MIYHLSGLTHSNNTLYLIQERCLVANTASYGDDDGELVDAVGLKTNISQ